ncbi:hypothetical protein LWI28_012642 [Acer negundo]|uniref:Uncharacterized protein n=1 Tax=Acer negundo TaxID=4023 RepID=A0AAD5IHG6_ACENE|nr:hypothetical protein LWI28_012642 [Acer negundo]
MPIGGVPNDDGFESVKGWSIDGWLPMVVGCGGVSDGWSSVSGGRLPTTVVGYWQVATTVVFTSDQRWANSRMPIGGVPSGGDSDSVRGWSVDDWLPSEATVVGCRRWSATATSPVGGGM